MIKLGYLGDFIAYCTKCNKEMKMPNEWFKRMLHDISKEPECKYCKDRGYLRGGGYDIEDMDFECPYCK